MVCLLFDCIHMLFLYVTRFRSTKEDAKRYFELSIYRKNIGRRFAALYTAWAELCKSMGLIDDAVKALQTVRFCNNLNFDRFFRG